MRALVAHSLYLEVLVTLFELVKEIFRRSECWVVLVDRHSEPAGWLSNHPHQHGLWRNIHGIMLQRCDVRILKEVRAGHDLWFGRSTPSVVNLPVDVCAAQSGGASVTVIARVLGIRPAYAVEVAVQ